MSSGCFLTPISPSVEFLPWTDGLSVAVEGTRWLGADEGVPVGFEGNTDSVVDDVEFLPWAHGSSVGGHFLGSGLAGNPLAIVGLEGNEVATVAVDGELLPWSNSWSVGHHTGSGWGVHGNPLLVMRSHDDSLVSDLDTVSGFLAGLGVLGPHVGWEVELLSRGDGAVDLDLLGGEGGSNGRFGEEHL